MSPMIGKWFTALDGPWLVWMALISLLKIRTFLHPVESVCFTLILLLLYKLKTSIWESLFARICHYASSFLKQTWLILTSAMHSGKFLSGMVLVLESSGGREHLEVWVTSNPPFPNYKTARGGGVWQSTRIGTQTHKSVIINHFKSHRHVHENPQWCAQRQHTLIHTCAVKAHTCAWRTHTHRVDRHCIPFCCTASLDSTVGFGGQRTFFVCSENLSASTHFPPDLSPLGYHETKGPEELKSRWRLHSSQCWLHLWNLLSSCVHFPGCPSWSFLDQRQSRSVLSFPDFPPHCFLGLLKTKTSVKDL